MASFGFAINSYEIGSTVPIDATYSYNGVLVDANLNLTVTQPNTLVDAEYNNVAIPSVSTGVFQTFYNNTQAEGEYIAEVVFYTLNWSELGRRTESFYVGNLNLTDLDVKVSKLEPFTCPTNHIQLGILIGFFILAFLIYGFGLKQSNVMRPVFMGVGGFMMFILPFYVIACDLYLSILVWIISFALFGGAIASPYKRQRDDWD